MGKEISDDQALSCSIRLTTKLPEVVPNQTLSVPSTLSVDGLNDLVNHLLEQDPPVDYDFLIDGEFLRSSLAEYVSGRGLSLESALTLEYTHRHPAPNPGAQLPHPDWIACVAISNQSVFTGCYDHSVRQWKGDSECQIGCHTGPVKCLAVSSTAMVTGSKDRSVRLWSLDGSAPVSVGNQHTDSVECVAICPSSPDMVASGSWDRSIRLWVRGDEPVSAPAPKKKSRKAKQRSTTAETALIQRSILDGVHSQTVSDLCWPEPSALYSVSWDRILRRLDSVQGASVQSWTLPDAASCVAFHHETKAIAVGHADRTIRLFDSRQPGPASKALRGHLAWVSDLAWAPGSATQLVSSSYDCTLKVWDIRSSVPLHTLKADIGQSNAKTLAVDWGRDGLIACGGTDCQLRLHRAQQ